MAAIEISLLLIEVVLKVAIILFVLILIVMLYITFKHSKQTPEGKGAREVAACKLYVRAGNITDYLGTFKNKKKAEQHFNLIRARLDTFYGAEYEPVYVEAKKGKGT